MNTDDLAVNCRWLINKIDEIFYAMCPSDKTGTWQQRTEMAVQRVKELSQQTKITENKQ